MKSFKEIMEEQKEEAKKKTQKEQEEWEEKQKEESKKKLEKVKYYDRLLKLKTYDAPHKLSFLNNEENDYFFGIDRVIYSLLIPENRTKPRRYLDCYSNKIPEGTVLDGKTIFDIIGKDYIYFVLDRMYTSYYVLAWIEDGLYKALEFNSTRCPSGYCDGESVHFLVATTVEELIGMIDYVELKQSDIQKIQKEFDLLPNKERIIQRVKTVKEEMMATYWHPDRYEKWAFDDDD